MSCLWLVTIAAVVILCFSARGAYGRNETVHACELVMKCFHDADAELMQCQNILSGDSSASSNGLSNEATSNNETTVEPTTAAPSDDCMASIKQKVQQKRALIEQRAQAFALCLNQRMDRGPEDVDPRKFRYCNTVISRYNARTTVATPPEFTLTTTTSADSASTDANQQQHRRTTTTVVTISNTKTKSTTHAASSTVKPSSTSGANVTSSPNSPTSRSGSAAAASVTASSSRPPPPPPGSIRPRRQAPNSNSNLELENAPGGDVFAAAAANNGSNGDIIRPSAAATPPAGKRLEPTTIAVIEPVTASTKIGEKSTDPFDIAVPTTNGGSGSTSSPLGQKQSSSQEPPAQQQQQLSVPAENEAGRIGAVARFSSNAALSKDPSPSTKNNNTTGQQFQSTALPPLDQQNTNDGTNPQVNSEPEVNQNINSSQLEPQQQKTSPENPASALPPVGSSSPVPNFPNAVSPPAAGPPGFNPPLGGGLPGGRGDNRNTKAPLSESSSPTSRNAVSLQQQPSTTLPDVHSNVSFPASLKSSGNNGNNTLGASAVLVQQQEQAEVNLVQAVPLDPSSIDPAQQPPPPQEFNTAISPPPSDPAPPASASAPLAPIIASTASVPPTPAAATATATATAAATGIPNVSASIAASVAADEKQRNRVETLRESRRRVSEFKACMARARIKREECKPLVNCCPDTVKCHLRYELSELHDQIHRLELEISEGRQACIEKKRGDDAAVDVLDQIDEEDLISDESIVSQQVF